MWPLMRNLMNEQARQSLKRGRRFRIVLALSAARMATKRHQKLACVITPLSEISAGYIIYII